MQAPADIVPRSLWDSFGVSAKRVRVLAVGGGYVTFVAIGDVQPLTMHQGEFRRLYLPLYDRRVIRSRFSTCVANLVEFTVYWVPSARTIAARSIGCSRSFTIPPDAVLVGVFASGITSDEFLEDLDCVLAKLNSSAVRPAT